MVDERDRGISWRSSRLGGESLTSHRSGRMIAIRGTPRLVHRHGWTNPTGSVRSRTGGRVDSAREGMLEGFSLGNYLLSVGYTDRLFREGKAAISRALAAILELKVEVHVLRSYP